VADVWLDNSGSPDALAVAVDALWDERLVPFAANLRAGRARLPRTEPVDPDPEWPAQAARLVARVAAAAGERGRVAHVGATAVPGLPAVDVLDLQLGVGTPDDVAAVHDRLSDLGFPACPPHQGPMAWDAQAGCHASADPGRPAHVLVQVVGSPAWRQVLVLRDWLRSDLAVRASYAEAKRRGAAESGGDPDRYAQAKAAWFGQAVAPADAWAASSGWVPSLDKAE
jgi:dephospho-CoA kinase